MEMPSQRSMDYLTEDLLIEILLCLPLISILRFRCVCKSWYKLLDLKFLDKKLDYDVKNENLKLLVTRRKTVHLDYKHHVESKSLMINEDIAAVKIVHPFKKPCGKGDILIVGSCNGLVCAHQYGSLYYVWNPCTAEYKVITSPFGFLYKCCGFGYDSRTCDYKFVSLYCQPSMDVSQVEIYSLGSDSWKTFNSFVPYQISDEEPGVFLNGAFHWLANPRTSRKLRPGVLVSMGIEDGVFKEIPLPAEHMDNFDYRFVSVLRGCLCLLSSVSMVSFEIWEMRDYGVGESWSKVFKTDLQELSTMGIGSCQRIRRAVYLKNNEILLEITKQGYYPYGLGAVDVVKIHLDETNRRQRMGYVYMTNIYEMEAYVESLVSVNSGTFVGDEQTNY